MDTPLTQPESPYELNRRIEHILQRLQSLREKHGADMSRLGMRGAVAAGAMMAGQRGLGLMEKPMVAYSDAETATAQLRAALMHANQHSSLKRYHG